MLPTQKDFKIKYNRTPLLARGSIKVRIIILFSMITTCMIFTQLVFANNLATDGQKLSDVQIEIKQLESENTTLKAEIAKHSALTELAEKAESLGFKKPEKLTIL